MVCGCVGGTRFQEPRARLVTLVTARLEKNLLLDLGYCKCSLGKFFYALENGTPAAPAGLCECKLKKTLLICVDSFLIRVDLRWFQKRCTPHFQVLYSKLVFLEPFAVCACLCGSAVVGIRL